ncbi:IPT/TIG domain-containing protein [Streptomyces novaecaesareae]|uniref:IPT/TIG domain-containing protein n=1 Tax=Streptomyces novaecaesareae TaxID=68244 RepID=UPI00068B1B46|nr:IPT/TIG domain-containing protein [Streptomyces novaecaesareae]
MAPVISSISPTSGHAGQTMTITGTGLGSLSTTKVNVGSTMVTPTTASSTSVTFSTPPGCAGQTNVSVTVSGVNSNSKSFFYVAVPTVTSVNPSAGSATPGVLHVFGTGFATATSVAFGAAGTAVPTVLSDSHLTVTSPAHGPFSDCTDSVDVQVTNVGGTSAPTGPAGQFTYNAAPTVTGVNPGAGTTGTPTAGVIVSGTCFAVGSTVTLTSGATVVSATNVNVNNDTTLSCNVPALTAGTYDVQVTTPDGGTSAVVVADEFVVA